MNGFDFKEVFKVIADRPSDYQHGVPGIWLVTHVATRGRCAPGTTREVNAEIGKIAAAGELGEAHELTTVIDITRAAGGRV